MDRKLIVFVCTGNVCRSPMAEYLFRDALGSEGGWDVCSAGVSASYGIPASREAVAVLREKGIDLTPHSSRPLGPELAAAATWLVVMASDHRDMIRYRFPEASRKVRLMLSFRTDGQEHDIADPIGMTQDMYRKVRSEIESAIPGLLAYLQTRTQA